MSRLVTRAVLYLAPLAALAQSDWTSYGKNPLGWRYSELTEINTANVQKLAPQWINQTGVVGAFETTPLVFGGLMYFTGPSNHAWAIDALTGRQVWAYSAAAPTGLNLCCGQVNRGFAVIGDKLFKVNIQGTLVALNRRTGAALWETQLADYKKGFSATAAPLAVKNLVVTGIAGAEFGTRGFVDAYDADTGKQVWRFYTVAAAGEPGGETWSADSWKRGGGSTWVTGTYDPDLNLIYWGTGNPGPDMNGDVRKGDNLYTCSVVAIDADTGKLRWYYQYTPHDVHDWDSASDPVLANLNIAGRTVKALIMANRNGFYYAIDRTTGKFLLAKPYTQVSWADSIGPEGRPRLIAGQDPSEAGTRACPGLGGGHNWQPTAYSPQTGLYYFPSYDGCHLFFKTDQEFLEGAWYQLSTVDNVPQEHSTGSIVAVDATTGETRWRFPMISGTSGGVLATAGGLVFVGDGQGYLIAFDAKSGKVLWKFQTGGRIAAPPISYSMRGQQYIALAAGQSILTFALPR